MDSKLIIALACTLLLGFGIGWFVFHQVKTETVVPDEHETAVAVDSSAIKEAAKWKEQYEALRKWALSAPPDTVFVDGSPAVVIRTCNHQTVIDSLLAMAKPAYDERQKTFGDSTKGTSVRFTLRTGYNPMIGEFAFDWSDVVFTEHHQNINTEGFFSGFHVGTLTRFGLKGNAPAQADLHAGWKIETPKLTFDPIGGYDSYLKWFAGVGVDYFPAR